MNSITLHTNVDQPKLSHDDEGMYLVRHVGECRYDVYQQSSGTIVASSALEETAHAAAKALNACAIIPRLSL